MIPLTILYDEYTDRRKLTEQKTYFEYPVPPPTKVVSEQKIWNPRKQFFNKTERVQS